MKHPVLLMAILQRVGSSISIIIDRLIVCISSSNVVILIDFDISGKSIAIQLPGAKWIRIDFQTFKTHGN